MAPPMIAAGSKKVGRSKKYKVDVIAAGSKKVVKHKVDVRAPPVNQAWTRGQAAVGVRMPFWRQRHWFAVAVAALAAAVIVSAWLVRRE